MTKFLTDLDRPTAPDRVLHSGMTHTPILKRVPDSLLDGLPPDDQAAIRTAVGKPVTVVPEGERTYATYPGDADKIEVEFRDDAGDIHTIWVDAADLC